MSILGTGRIEAARTRLYQMVMEIGPGPNSALAYDLQAALAALNGYQRVRDAMEAYQGEEWKVVTTDYVLRLLDGEVG